MSGAEWVNASASVFSAVGTVGAFAVGFILLRREHQREEEHAGERRRSQAAKVSAWVEAQRNHQGGMELYFNIHNASGMPIYEVSLPIPAPSGQAQRSEFLGMVPPGQTLRRDAPKEWLTSYFSPEPVQVEFLDSSGLLWTRDEQGFLVEIPRRMHLSEPEG
jgi:hypothetical protein